MFDHFRSYGTGGPDFRELAPVLPKRMYTYNIRSILGGLTDAELAEAVAIVQRATDSPASAGDGLACHSCSHRVEHLNARPDGMLSKGHL